MSLNFTVEDFIADMGAVAITEVTTTDIGVDVGQLTKTLIPFKSNRIKTQMRILDAVITAIPTVDTDPGTVDIGRVCHFK